MKPSQETLPRSKPRILRPPMSLFTELKRRNVLRVVAAYVAVSWLLIQVVETLFPVFGLSDAASRGVVIVLASGLIPAVVIACQNLGMAGAAEAAVKLRTGVAFLRQNFCCLFDVQSVR